MGNVVVVHGGDVYGAAAALGRDWRELLDFSASINPLGPASGVRQAICDAVERLVHYPDPNAQGLVEELAALWRVPARCILPGNGATELLHFLARIVSPSHVTLGVPAFSEFHRAYPHAREVPVTASASWPVQGWLILTNPVNPFGSLLCRESLLRHIENSSQPVLVDESFLDFTDESSLSSLAVQRHDLFILRSLTKFYALPGLRVGALVASEKTMARLRMHREPWQVNVLAEAAAIASARDAEYAERTRRFVRSERAWLSTQIAALSRTSVAESSANFLAVTLDRSATRLTARLRERGILIRDCTNWPGVEGEAVRVAVRTRAENQCLVEHWREAVCAS